MDTDTGRDTVAADEFARAPEHSLDCITRQAHGYIKRLGYTDAAGAHEFVDEQDAIVRNALLTPREARTALKWAERIDYLMPGSRLMVDEPEALDKLRRIAGDS